MAEEEQSANTRAINYSKFSGNPSSKDVTLAIAGVDTLDELYAMPFEVWTKITPVATKLLYGTAGEQMGQGQWEKFFDKNMDSMKKVGEAIKGGASARDSMRLSSALEGLLPTYGQALLEKATLAERKAAGTETDKKSSGDGKGLVGGAKVSEAKLRRRRSLLGG